MNLFWYNLLPTAVEFYGVFCLIIEKDGLWTITLTDPVLYFLMPPSTIFSPSYLGPSDLKNLFGVSSPFTGLSYPNTVLLLTVFGDIP